MVELWSEESGSGPAVLLVHAAIGDSRMWEPQWDALTSAHRVVRCDLRGFGRTGFPAGDFSHCDDVIELLDARRLDSVVVVGASLGGRVAIELALARPERVRGLVLVNSALAGYAWSDEVRAFGRAEDDALERGDLDAAVELNLSFFLDGPARNAANVPAATRSLVADMQRTAFEHELSRPADADERLAVDDHADRLGDIVAPAMIVVGESDVGDFHAIATTLASEIPGSQLCVIADAAHLPSLEDPASFNDELAEFLSSLHW